MRNWLRFRRKGKEAFMYCVEGKICGFKVNGSPGNETFFMCFDKSQVNEIDKKYFVPAVWTDTLDKLKDPKDPTSAIFALEVTKKQAPKEGEKYILEITCKKDWLKSYVGRRLTVKFDSLDAAKKREASEIVFID
jgi:hypothetical protein